MGKLKVKPDKDKTALQLKITLLDLRPEVWRRVVVPAYMTLEDLHWIIQEVMPWTDSHLHQFKMGNKIYSDVEMEFLDESSLKQFDESKITLAKLFSKVNTKIEYEYDFGDGWRHEVKFEKVLPLTPANDLHCLDGERACPPDDCGGVWGYAELLESISDPNNPRYEDMIDWLGDEKFDPEKFDAKEANRRLKHLFKKVHVDWAKEEPELEL